MVAYSSTEIEQLYWEDRARSFARKTHQPTLDDYDEQAPSDGRGVSEWIDFWIRQRNGSLVHERGYVDNDLNEWIDLET